MPSDAATEPLDAINPEYRPDDEGDSDDSDDAPGVATDDAPVSPDELTPADELYRVAKLTHADGTVDATVLDWEKTGPDDDAGPANMTGVEIEGLTPTGERFTDTYAWPEYADPEEYTFIQIINAAGYDLAQAEHVNADPDATVRARNTDSGWTFDPPEPTPTRREQWRERLTGLGLSKDGDGIANDFWTAGALFPLLWLGGLFIHLEHEGAGGADAGYTTACWHMALWLMAIIALVVVVL